MVYSFKIRKCSFLKYPVNCESFTIVKVVILCAIRNDESFAYINAACCLNGFFEDKCTSNHEAPRDFCGIFSR